MRNPPNPNNLFNPKILYLGPEFPFRSTGPGESHHPPCTAYYLVLLLDAYYLGSVGGAPPYPTLSHTIPSIRLERKGTVRPETDPE